MAARETRYTMGMVATAEPALLAEMEAWAAGCWEDALEMEAAVGEGEYAAEARKYRAVLKRIRAAKAAKGVQ